MTEKITEGTQLPISQEDQEIDILDAISVVADDKANQEAVEGGDDEDDFDAEEADTLAAVEEHHAQSSKQIKEYYLNEALPNENEFKSFFPATLESLTKEHHTENDYFLRRVTPNKAVGSSIKFLGTRYKNYARVSAYNPKEGKFTPLAQRFRPEHAHTEGGKGLTNYSRPVIYTTSGMCLPLGSWGNMVETPEGPKEWYDYVLEAELNWLPTNTDPKREFKVKHADGNFYNITKLMDNGTKDIYRWNLSNGLEVVCTLNHHFPFTTEQVTEPNTLALYKQKSKPIADIFKEEQFLIQDGKSVSILGYSKIGESRVGDIQVDSPDHTYLINGVSIHNSTINPINVAFGCPSFCSFCKEAILARSHTEMNALETTGTVILKHNGEEREFPAKTTVEYYDQQNETIVYGPVQIPLAHNFPIKKSSLDKLFLGTLGRYAAD